MTRAAINTLVCHARYTRTLGYFDDWQDAFRQARPFAVTSLNLAEEPARRAMASRIREFDLVVLLHSTNGDTLEYLRPFARPLQHRRGKLVSFVGNELNMPFLGLREKLALLAALEPDFVATQLPLDAGQWLYQPLTRTKVIALPHALNPDRFAPVIPPLERTLDLGVRSYRYLPIIGDNERNRLLDFFEQTPFDPPLALDLSTAESDRFDSSRWAGFLNRCRGTLATEAGGYFLERDDHTVQSIMAFIEARKAAPGQARYNAARRFFRRLVPRPLRRGLKRLVPPNPYERNFSQLARFENLVTFEEIQDRFYRDYPNPVSGKCISSRHFDAIGTKTVQIMFPGRFNDILEADRHYLALARDFSNAREVLEKFRDPGFRNKMADEAHEFVSARHTYAHRMDELARHVEAPA